MEWGLRPSRPTASGSRGWLRRCGTHDERMGWFVGALMMLLFLGMSFRREGRCYR